MMKRILKGRRSFFIKLALAVLTAAILLFAPVKLQKDGGRYAITVSAYQNPSIAILEFDVDMTVQKDRKILVNEKITVQFLRSGLSMFYRSLAKNGARYSDIVAKCEDNDAFYYEVADNPDYDEFLDINCIGGAQKGNTWTYDISYTMIGNKAADDNGMIIDVVGFGWPVELNDVTVTMHFPAPLSASDYQVYVGYDNDEADTKKLQQFLSEDGKTLTLTAETLPLSYIYDYDEYMADGVTLDFTLPDGALDGYTMNRILTENITWIVLAGIACVLGAAVLLTLTRKKQDIITVVNVTAPDDMDPLKMGKWLDGTVDSEDITSMIYYFAHKGYLLINLEDEDDPLLIRKVRELPQGTPAYQRTLFEGLFKGGKDSVHTSDLAEKYYASVQTATLQVPSPKMYEKKSIFGFFGGGLIGLLYAFILPLAISTATVGGGYGYFAGFLFVIPIALNWLLGYVGENYRYKWKKSARLGMGIVRFVVAALSVIVFGAFFARHFLTGYETFAIGIFALLCAFMTTPALSRKDSYVKELGDILGFKDFILYTEEDKIKFMLEQDPELYYKVLPYAQVLGVTDAWEEKFKDLLLEPPSWCVGSDMTVFDYMIFHRCMTRAFATAMTLPQSESGVGRSGGGGSFGGFGGGGFGGGGGGAR